MNATTFGLGGSYHAPAQYLVKRDGAPWPAANLRFEDSTSIEPGAVTVVLDNITGLSPADYQVEAKDSTGKVWRMSYRYEPQPECGADLSGLPAELDTALTASHGAGAWNTAGTVTVLPFQGSVSYENASYGSDVHVVRGDSVTVPYSAGMDLTGWEVWFGVKANPADAAYAIGPLDASAGITDPQAGTGLISLSVSDTDIAPRRYFAEVELRSQGQVKTPLRFYLWIDADVVR